MVVGSFCCSGKFYSVTFKDLFELAKIKTSPLAPTVQPFIKHFLGYAIVFIQAVVITYNPIVVVIPTGRLALLCSFLKKKIFF